MRTSVAGLARDEDLYWFCFLAVDSKTYHKGYFVDVVDGGE